MELTGVLSIHELECLLFMTESFTVVILASRQVLTERLRVKIGAHR